MATVEFFGETFALEPEMSEFALMEFAEASDSGVAQNSMAAMAAMLRLLKTCIAADDAVDGDGAPCEPYGLQRFLASARKNRPKPDDLIAVLDAAAHQVAERPTERSAASSDGPPSIELKSVSISEDRGLQLMAGRPDLQLAVRNARASA